MNKISNIVAAGVFLLTAVVAAPPSAGAEESASSEEMMKMFKRLDKRVAEQDRRITELKAELKKERSQKTRYEEIKSIVKELNAEAGDAPVGLPQWMENLKFYGDLRLRYQHDCFSTNARNRNRGRFRLRLGIRKTWLDKQLEVGFRLASGSNNDPTSTNQTFDNNFSKKPIWIDRAYAKYSPKSVKGLTLVGGKMANPFVHTDMIWDSDLNPEGVWGVYKYPGMGSFEPFAGAGYFQLVHNRGAHDGTMYGYQTGFNWKVVKDVKWTSAVTYYDFDHYENNYTAADGNTELNGLLTAEEFHVFNLINKVSFKALNLPMSVYVDYAHNCGNNLAGESDALGVGYKIGKNKTKGDWSASYQYKYIEANATPGGFNDGSFGGSNRKGHVFGAKYNITDYLTVGASVYYTQPVSDDNTGDTTTTAIGDLVWNF